MRCLSCSISLFVWMGTDYLSMSSLWGTGKWDFSGNRWGGGRSVGTECRCSNYPVCLGLRIDQPPMTTLSAIGTVLVSELAVFACFGMWFIERCLLLAGVKDFFTPQPCDGALATTRGRDAHVLDGGSRTATGCV